MTDITTYTTTKRFTADFKQIKRLARAGAVVELHERGEVFTFSRKGPKGGLWGALKGKVASRAKTEELFSGGETWEAA
jgi:hypothetical protein